MRGGNARAGAMGSMGLGMRPLRAGTRPLRADVAAVFAGNGGSWYDVGDLASLKRNSDGTGAVSIGDPVGYLADQSGNGRPLTNAAPTQRPVLTMIDGHHALAFDGVDDVLWHQTGASTGSLNQGSDGYMLLAGRREENSGAVFCATYLATTRYWRITGIITNSRLTASVRGTGGNFQPIVANMSAPLSAYGITTSRISATSTTTTSPNGSTASIAVTGDIVNNGSRISLGGLPGQGAATPSFWSGFAIYLGAPGADAVAILRSYFA